MPLDESFSLGIRISRIATISDGKPSVGFAYGNFMAHLLFQARKLQAIRLALQNTWKNIH
eukprot:1340259-Amorphochlora_amoeboformis.AAC.1